jgi:hypothetical protein
LLAKFAEEFFGGNSETLPAFVLSPSSIEFSDEFVIVLRRDRPIQKIRKFDALLRGEGKQLELQLFSDFRHETVLRSKWIFPSYRNT